MNLRRGCVINLCLLKSVLNLPSSLNILIVTSLDDSTEGCNDQKRRSSYSNKSKKNKCKWAQSLDFAQPIPPAVPAVAAAEACLSCSSVPSENTP